VEWVGELWGTGLKSAPPASVDRGAKNRIYSQKTQKKEMSPTHPPAPTYCELRELRDRSLRCSIDAGVMFEE